MKIEYIENINSLYKIIKKFGGDYPVIGCNKPLKRIFSLLERQREISNEEFISVFISENYFDEEWQKEYDKHYKFMFIAPREKIAGFCSKLDFFLGKIENISDLSSLDGNKFLGYMILRPLPTQKVCEAVISMPCENPRNSFITCKTKFSSKIENYKFEITGFPFVQQDIITGVCAHACLKMICLYLSNKNKTPSLFISEIEDISKDVPAETMTVLSAEGLWTTHLYKVFKKMDCKSLIYIFPEEDDSKQTPYKPYELIYPYIESGFPVLVGFQTEKGAHSVVIIGHTFDPDSWWPEARNDYYHQLLPPPRPPYIKSFAWTDFIIQDDNFGPYLTMPRDFPLITTVAIPIPKDIPLIIAIEDAEAISYSYISDERLKKFISKLIKDEMEGNEKKWLEFFYHHLVEGKLVLRTFLVEKKKLKLYFNNRNDIHPNVMEFYQLLTKPEINLPEMLWFTEISIPELFSHKRYCLGEILIDPTCPISIFGEDKAIISIHLMGIIITINFDTGKQELIRVKDDFPYQHILRS